MFLQQCHGFTDKVPFINQCKIMHALHLKMYNFSLLVMLKGQLVT